MRKNTEKGPISARELLGRLKRGSEHSNRIINNDEGEELNVAKYRSAVAPLLSELRSEGFLLKTVSDLIREKRYRSESDYKRALPILLRWLPRIADQHVRDDIVRTLSVPWARSQAAPLLIREFERETNALLKWTIGNALSVVADNDVFEDILRLSQDKKHGRAREMVVEALGNMADPRAVSVLIELLKDEEIAGHAIIALGKLRAHEARSHIEAFLKHPRSWIRNEARRTLAKLKG